jgi:hypothetical protein
MEGWKRNTRTCGKGLHEDAKSAAAQSCAAHGREKGARHKKTHFNS